MLADQTEDGGLTMWSKARVGACVLLEMPSRWYLGVIAERTPGTLVLAAPALMVHYIDDMGEFLAGRPTRLAPVYPYDMPDEERRDAYWGVRVKTPGGEMVIGPRSGQKRLTTKKPDGIPEAGPETPTEKPKKEKKPKVPPPPASPIEALVDAACGIGTGTPPPPPEKPKPGPVPFSFGRNEGPPPDMLTPAAGLTTLANIPGFPAPLAAKLRADPYGISEARHVVQAARMKGLAAKETYTEGRPEKWSFAVFFGTPGVERDEAITGSDAFGDWYAVAPHARKKPSEKKEAVTEA